MKHHKTLIQGYNYTLVYEKGGEQFPSDYLSRHPIKSNTQEDGPGTWDLDIDMMIKYALPDAISQEEMQKANKEGKEMQARKEAVEAGHIEKGREKVLQPYKKMLAEISEVEGMMMRGDRIIVPEAMHNKVVKIAHEGHLGIVKTKQLIKDTMWFPNIKKWVEDSGVKLK